VQGAVHEHVRALEHALRKQGLSGRAEALRRPEQLAQCDGVVLPGGESTTISKLLVQFGLHDLLAQRSREEDLPVLGTCAGLILMAREGDEQVAQTGTRLLGMLSISVDRNAFGRQRDSFEAAVHVDGVGAFPAVFIRSPAVRRAWGATRVISTLGETIVGVREGNRTALCFHPELTPDTRLHEQFVRTCAEWRKR
jgi:5'-phosphate synthase pdxT subunit